jgi:MFS family permease
MKAQTLEGTKGADAGKAVSAKFEVGGKRASYVLWICSLLYMVNFMDRQVFSVAAAPMMKALGMTKAEVGWINNIFLLTIACLGIPVSYIIDRWSRRKMICILGLIWSVGTFLTGLGVGFFTVLVSMMIVGFGEAGFGPGGTALIGASFPPAQRGAKLGVFNMFIGIGIVVGLIAGGYCAQTWGWRAPFFVFAIPGIVLSLMALKMQDYPTPPKAQTGENFGQSFVAIWKTPTLVWLYLGYGMFMAMFMGNLFWMVPALIFRFKIGVALAPLIVGGLIFVSLWAVPLGGWIADRWEAKTPGGRMRTAACCSILAGLFVIVYYYLAFFAHTGSLAWAPVLLLGFFCMFLQAVICGGVGPAVGATTQMVVPVQRKSLSFGVAMACMYALGGGWGSGFAGMIGDRLGTGQPGDWKGLAYGVMIISCAAILGGIFWFISASHYESDLKKVQQ